MEPKSDGGTVKLLLTRKFTFQYGGYVISSQANAVQLLGTILYQFDISLNQIDTIVYQFDFVSEFCRKFTTNETTQNLI